MPNAYIVRVKNAANKITDTRPKTMLSCFFYAKPTGANPLGAFWLFLATLTCAKPSRDVFCPGVKGIGPKGGSQLLREFGTLEGVFAGRDSVSSMGIRGAKALQALLRCAVDACIVAAVHVLWWTCLFFRRGASCAFLCDQEIGSKKMS